MQSRPQVVIIGGGFAGLQAARSLKSSPVDVTLIDKRNFHLFQPLLYQVATGGLSPGDITSPLRAVLRRQKNVTVVMDEIVDFDPQQGTAIGQQSSYAYDYLIVAVGVKYHYFGNPNWEAFAPSLKTVEQALEIRSCVLNAFESAERESDPEKQRALMTFAIVGAGPTGVELAGAIGELAHSTLKGNFRRIDPAHARVVLIEAGDRILNSFPDRLSARSLQALNRLGVEVLTQHRVTHIGPDQLELEGPDGPIRLEASTKVWAAGVRSVALAKQFQDRFGAEVDALGRIKVDAQLALHSAPQVMVLGDMAHVQGSDGQPLAGIAPVAMQQGRFAAKRVKDLLAGTPAKPFRYHDKGTLAVIGRNAAVADLGTLKVSGFPAWLLWVVIHIAYLVEFDNKLMVLFQWAWNYLTRKRGARLISHSKEIPIDG